VNVNLLLLIFSPYLFATPDGQYLRFDTKDLSKYNGRKLAKPVFLFYDILSVSICFTCFPSDGPIFLVWSYSLAGVNRPA